MPNEHLFTQRTQCDDGITTKEGSAQGTNVELSPVKDFISYKCFYCNRTIISEDQLKSHKTQCHKVCSICDAQCKDTTDLQFHMFQYLTWILSTCNQCPTNFNSKAGLQSHRSYSHGIWKRVLLSQINLQMDLSGVELID